MQLQRHTNAGTTPAIRQELRTSILSINGLSKPTVRTGRRRDDTAERTHTPHRLRTTLSASQEAVVVALRRTLPLPLDDRLAVTREFVCEGISRSGLDRRLRRHGCSDLKALLPLEQTAMSAPRRFKDDDPGFVHVDAKSRPQIPDEDHRRFLFAAIERAGRWVYVAVLPEKSAAGAQGFLELDLATAPFRVAKVLTDNGKELTDRFCATAEREPTGKHPVRTVCAARRIEHGPIAPACPQTDGMIERFNGRIGEVLATHRFRSGEHLEDTLTRDVGIYNIHIPQRALGHLSPIDALQEWQEKRPEPFVSEIKNLPELDS